MLETAMFMLSIDSELSSMMCRIIYKNDLKPSKTNAGKAMAVLPGSVLLFDERHASV